MLTIDGSFGEGGGQIVRSSLALSMVMGRPFRIENVRAGREKPGLLRQHLTAVRAAATVCGATVEGDAIGSGAFSFIPGKVSAGEYTFSVGTAGSATLVLQTVLPALLRVSGRSVLTLEGGTHNPHAPPFDFLAKAFLPLVNRIGPKVEANLERAGFYPAGGGRFIVQIEPTPRLSRLELTERGSIDTTRARAVLCGLPRHIAERELKVVQKKLGWADDRLIIEEVTNAQCPGNVVLLEVGSEHVTEVFTGFGEIHRAAEAVATHAVQQCQRYLAAGAPVGEYLADQLVLILAIGGGGAYATLPLSRHATTHIELIKRFNGPAITLTGLPNRCVRVDVASTAH